MRLPAALRRPRRPAWGWLLLALALGAGVALGQAPFGYWALALVALSFLFPLGQRLAAGWVGLAAGTGYGAAAMFWIAEPFFVEPEIHGWMAPFAVAFMSLGMGAFWALGMGLGARLAGSNLAQVGPAAAPAAPAAPLRAAGMAAGLFAAELARSFLFTGFPWVLFGHIWLETPVAQLAALIGAPGLSFLTLLIAVAPWLCPNPNRRWLADAAAGGALALCWLWGQGQLAALTPPRAPTITLRLVQPNAPQHLKWRPEYRETFFFRHLDLTAAPAAPGKPAPDLILWPETAVPFLLERPGEGLAMVAEAAGGTPVALGIQRGEGLRYFNSLAVIGPGGAVGPVYDKLHLVPFGEYMPFGDALVGLGISAFAAQAGNGYSAGQPGGQSGGQGDGLLNLGAAGRALPLICYEAVFASDIRRTMASGGSRPDWLLQITNDAWFGTVSGPFQHLAQARFRAIEFGLPLARAANTGVSAMIDARGRVVESLGMGVEGVIDAPLPPALPATFYAKAGDVPIISIFATISALISLIGRKYRVDRNRRRV